MAKINIKNLMKTDDINKAANTISAAVPLVIQIADAVSPRLKETSTHLGTAVIALATPEIIQHVTTAVALGVGGDYIGCAQNAIPVLIGLFAALKAIVTPDPIPV